MKKIAPIISVILLVLIDQITKYFTITCLKDNSAFVIIKGVLEFRYVENRGAAFGIFQGAIPYFIITTFVLLAIIIIAYIRLPKTQKMFPLRLLCVLIAAGGIGNLIDRIFRGFVVDMIYFKLIDFPVFNVADCYVTVSEILLIILVLFYYKDEDFKDFHIFKKKAKAVENNTDASFYDDIVTEMNASEEKNVQEATASEE